MNRVKVTIILSALITFCGELYAENMIINGKNYYLDSQRIVDDNNHRLSKEEIMELSLYGFDYNTWNRLRIERSASAICLFSGCIMAATINFQVDSSSQPWEVAVGAIGIAVIGVGAILNITSKNGFEKFLGRINNDLTISATNNGFGLIYSF